MAAVLVTGGAGFIGSHTCKALSAAGFVPVSFDNLSTGFRHNVKWGHLVTGDLADREALRAVFRDYPISGVLHFAASAYVGESVVKPLEYYRNNVAGSLNLLEVISEHGVPPLVFSRSCATYGVPIQNPIPASHPQSPVNPYGWSKLMGERMILDSCAAYGLRYGVLRYFNAAGADAEGDLREEHNPETHLIPLAIDAAAGTAPALTVFGADYPTPDGTCIRDYIHVADLAAAHVEAMRSLLAGAPSFVKNLGTGKGSSVRQVLASIKRVSGAEVPHTVEARRPGDPPALEAVVEPEDLHRLRYQNLDDIIRSAWNSRQPAVRAA